MTKSKQFEELKLVKFGKKKFLAAVQKYIGVGGGGGGGGGGFKAIWTKSKQKQIFCQIASLSVKSK